MTTFSINGILWRIAFVGSNSSQLFRSDGSVTVGVTDLETKCVYLSNRLRGAFLEKVICHELVHCFMFSHDINIPLEQEEFMADWMSMYGKELIYLLDGLMQNLIVRAV